MNRAASTVTISLMSGSLRVTDTDPPRAMRFSYDFVLRYMSCNYMKRSSNFSFIYVDRLGVYN